MSTKYTVIIRDYALNHFIDEFEKKHKRSWEITWRAVSVMMGNMEEFLQTSKAEIIYQAIGEYIIKCEFAVAGRGESPHASGNRIIVSMNSQNHTCEVLLVYNKGHIAGNNETSWWTNLIHDQYPDMRDIIPKKR